MKKKIRQKFNYETWLTLCSLIKSTKGVSESGEGSSYVISLTSIPSRIDKVHMVIESLLSQSYKPKKVILWLSEYNREGVKVLDINDLPLTLRKQVKRGLEICFCKDLRSYRKLLPTIERYPESHIVTADDDIIYPSDWLENLVVAHRGNPDCVICYRGVEMQFNEGLNCLKPYIEWPEYNLALVPSFLLFPQGGEGTIYPKNIFNKELFNDSVFLDICLTADDVWFKAMSLFNDKPCVKITEKHQDFLRVRESQGQDTLHFVNNTLGQNDIQIKAVFEKYSLIDFIKAQH